MTAAAAAERLADWPADGMDPIDGGARHPGPVKIIIDAHNELCARALIGGAGRCASDGIARIGYPPDRARSLTRPMMERDPPRAASTSLVVARWGRSSQTCVREALRGGWGGVHISSLRIMWNLEFEQCNLNLSSGGFHMLMHTGKCETSCAVAQRMI